MMKKQGFFIVRVSLSNLFLFINSFSKFNLVWSYNSEEVMIKHTSQNESFLLAALNIHPVCLHVN